MTGTYNIPHLWKEGTSVFGQYIDESSNDDFAVETVLEKKEGGTIIIVSVNIIPKEPKEPKK